MLLDKNAASPQSLKDSLAAIDGVLAKLPGPAGNEARRKFGDKLRQMADLAPSKKAKALLQTHATETLERANIATVLFNGNNGTVL